MLSPTSSAHDSYISLGKFYTDTYQPPSSLDKFEYEYDTTEYTQLNFSYDLKSEASWLSKISGGIDFDDDQRIKNASLLFDLEKGSLRVTSAELSGQIKSDEQSVNNKSFKNSYFRLDIIEADKSYYGLRSPSNMKIAYSYLNYQTPEVYSYSLSLYEDAIAYDENVDVKIFGVGIISNTVYQYLMTQGHLFDQLESDFIHKSRLASGNTIIEGWYLDMDLVAGVAYISTDSSNYSVSTKVNSTSSADGKDYANQSALGFGLSGTYSAGYFVGVRGKDISWALKAGVKLKESIALSLISISDTPEDLNSAIFDFGPNIELSATF